MCHMLGTMASQSEVLLDKSGSSEFVRHPDAQKVDVLGARGFEESFCQEVDVGSVDGDMYPGSTVLFRYVSLP